jgi:hypothetical protein
MKPEETADVATMRPGECPVIVDSKTGMSCDRDAACMEPQICCKYGQVSICVYPTVVDTLPKYKEPVLQPTFGNHLAAANRWLLNRLKLKTMKEPKIPQKPINVNPRIQKLLTKLSPKKSVQKKVFRKLNEFINWFMQQRKNGVPFPLKLINKPEKLTTIPLEPNNITPSPGEATLSAAIPLSEPDVTSVQKVPSEGYDIQSPIIIPMNVLSSTESPTSIKPSSSQNLDKTKSSKLLPSSEPESYPEVKLDVIPEPEEQSFPEPEITTIVPNLSSSQGTPLAVSVATTTTPVTPPPENENLHELFTDSMSENSLAEAGLALPSFKPIWHIIDPMSKQKIPLGKSAVYDAVSQAERKYERHIIDEYGPLKDQNDGMQSSFDNNFASYLKKTMEPPESNSVYPANSLLYPEVEVFKPEKQGSCPVNLMYRRCKSECTHDDECAGVDKCCDMGCGTVCVTPKEKKIY